MPIISPDPEGYAHCVARDFYESHQVPDVKKLASLFGLRTLFADDFGAFERRTGCRNGHAMLWGGEGVVLVRRGLPPLTKGLSSYHEVGHAILDAIEEALGPSITVADHEIWCDEFAFFLYDRLPLPELPSLARAPTRLLRRSGTGP